MKKFVIVVGAIAVIGAGGFYLWRTQAAPATAAARTGGAAQQVTVEVVTARSGTIVERAESVGTARANESITINAKQTGYIANIPFQEGQKVKANQVLIELENKERRANLDGAKADFDQARAARDEISQRLERSRELKKTGNVSDSTLDQLESQFRAAEGRVRSAEARVRSVDAQLDDVRINAPFEGRVGLRQVSAGALVQPGTIITTLDDISKIKLDFGVPEVFLGQLKSNLDVSAVSSAFPGRVFRGKITAVDTRVDPATRAVKVNATFDNADEALKPGMFLTASIVLAKREDAVIVPEEAIIGDGSKQFIYIVRDGKTQRREIQIGQRLQGEAEILKGVEAGDVVVARGTQKVRPGLAVNTVPIPTT